MSIQAGVYVNLQCPSCSMVLERVGDHLVCRSGSCEYCGEHFHIPTLPLVKANTEIEARTGTPRQVMDGVQAERVLRLLDSMAGELAGGDGTGLFAKAQEWIVEADDLYPNVKCWVEGLVMRSE